MQLRYEGLALPVSHKLANALSDIIAEQKSQPDALIINFRDPNYSAQNGGFHPVEMRLEKENDIWSFCYITDFTYVGSGYTAELVKELDFDFEGGLFQNLFGLLPLEQASDIYQIWESNFLHYWQDMDVFKITVST